MFSLIFSPYGSIKRKQYFYGIIFSIILVISCFLVVSIISSIILGVSLNKSEGSLNKQKIAELKLQQAQADVILASKEPSPEDVAKARAIKEQAAVEVMSNPVVKLFADIFVIPQIAIGLLFLWCNVCIMVKRLRDLAVTPWLVAIPLASYLCTLIPFSQASILVPYCLFVTAAFFLVCLFYPSRSLTSEDT